MVYNMHSFMGTSLLYNLPIRNYPKNVIKNNTKLLIRIFILTNQKNTNRINGQNKIRGKNCCLQKKKKFEPSENMLCVTRKTVVKNIFLALTLT